MAFEVGTGICPADGYKNAPGTLFIEGLVGKRGQRLWRHWDLAEHLQSIYGKDDMFEWFGGNMDAKWLVGGLGADDFTDYQLGYTGRVQYGLMYQSPDSPGNRGVEGDNSEYDQAGVPFSNPTFFNITYIGSGKPGFDEANSPGLFLRRGSRGSFNNLAFTNFFSPCIDISDASTQAQGDVGNVTMNGILCWKDNLGGAGATGPADTLAGNIPSVGANSAYTLAYAQGQKATARAKTSSWPIHSSPGPLSTAIRTSQDCSRVRCSVSDGWRPRRWVLRPKRQVHRRNRRRRLDRGVDPVDRRD